MVVQKLSKPASFIKPFLSQNYDSGLKTNPSVTQYIDDVPRSPKRVLTYMALMARGRTQRTRMVHFMVMVVVWPATQRTVLENVLEVRSPRQPRSKARLDVDLRPS